MYRIPLTKSGAIPLVTADERRLPVVDIPLGIEHAPGEIILLDNTVQTVDTYIFYCHSKPSSEKQQTGDGTKENPWDDLNVALKKLCCIINNSCDNCIACRLVVSGTIDYNVQPSALRLEYDGRHRLYIDFAQATLQYSEFGDGPSVARFARIRNSTIANVNLTDTYFVNDVSFETVPAFHSCHYCRFDSCVISTPCQAMIGCQHCVFDDVSVYLNKGGADSTSAFGSCYYSVFNNCKAFVQKVSAEFYSGWNAINGFENCWDGIFQNCTATFEGSGCCTGCGFTGNTNPTWIGSNVGYSIQRLHDDDGYCYDISVIYQTNQNCSDIPESSSSTPPSSSVVPPSSEEPPSSSSSEEPSSGGFKGAVSCKIIPRAVTAETYPYSSEVNQSCLHTWYTLRIGYCNSITDLGAGDNTRATVKRYGNPIMTYQGEHDYDEDGNPTDYCAEMWEYYDCYYNDAHVSELPKVCRDASADIDKLIDGTLGLPPVKEEPYPFPTDGWLGYTQWSLQRNWRGDAEYTLSKSGDTFPVDTEYGTGWYDIWGDTPCGGMNVTTRIMLHCVVFSWIPDSEHSKSPTKVRLKSPDGTVKEYDFGVEYCLQGKSDIDIPGLHYSTCEVAAEMDSCKYIVPDRVNAADSESNANFATSVKVERRYTYEGVK